MKRLLLLTGAPGSGKSYWAKKKFLPFVQNAIYISRDEIRFNMISDDEDYFAKENGVFAEFIHQINHAIDDPNIHTIIVDATHLNWASRNKTLRHLQLSKVDEVIPVIFNTPLETCLERNEKREGRAKVPRSVIRRMFYQWTSPRNDPFHYTDFVEVVAK